MRKHKFFELNFTDRVSTDVAAYGFLQLEDIKGESTDEAHEEEIDIYGIDLGRTVRVIRAVADQDRGAGKANVSYLSVIKPVDRASPLLQKAAASGEVFPTSTLSIRKAGDRQEEYLRIKMENVRVTSYQIAGTGTDNTPIPTEEVTFNFTKIEWE